MAVSSAIPGARRSPRMPKSICCRGLPGGDLAGNYQGITGNFPREKISPQQYQRVRSSKATEQGILPPKQGKRSGSASKTRSIVHVTQRSFADLDIFQATSWPTKSRIYC